MSDQVNRGSASLRAHFHSTPGHRFLSSNCLVGIAEVTHEVGKTTE